MRRFWPVLLLVGCSTPPVHRVAIARATRVVPDVPFAELDHDQRARWMKEHVLPAMTPLFHQHDPEKFDKVGCKTCHAENSWDMPNPELPHLDFTNLEGFERRDIEWMKTVILPAMKKQLRDPTLRCGRCHPVIGR